MAGAQSRRETALPVRHGAERPRLAPRVDPADLRSMKIAGRTYACAWCGARFKARRANQKFCGASCAAEFRTFCASHGPALVEMLLEFTHGRYRLPGSTEKAAAMTAWRDLLRRGRELRDLKAARLADR